MRPVKKFLIRKARGKWRAYVITSDIYLKNYYAEVYSSPHHRDCLDALEMMYGQQQVCMED